MANLRKSEINLSVENENEMDDLDSHDKLVGHKNEEKWNEKEMKGGKPLNADQILTAFGPKNVFLLLIWLATTFCWALAAMPMMASTFFMVDIPSRCNKIFNNSAVKNENNCSKIDDAACDEFILNGTLTEEFDLANASNFINIPQLSTTMYLVGVIIGAIVFPRLSDRKGRRPILCLSLILNGLFGCLSAFVPSVEMFLALRFLQGVFWPGVGIVCWVFAYESIAPSIRSYTALVGGCFWVFGYCSIAPMAFWLPNWRWLAFCASAPSSIFGLLYLKILPESLYWLAATKKNEEIVGNWINRANTFARIFGTPQIVQQSDGHFLVLGDQIVEEKSEKLIENVENSPNANKSAALNSQHLLLIFTILFAYLWVCDCQIYYGLSLFSTKLVGDIYLNYVWVGVVEIPSYLFSPIFLDKLGRRNFVSLAHLIAALAFFVIALNDRLYAAHSPCQIVPNEWLTLAMWLLGKFAISCSFTSLFVFATELFPTMSRNSRIGFCVAASRFGATFVPFVKQMSREMQLGIYGSMAAVGAVLAMFLRESRNRKLPGSSADLNRE